MWRTSLGLSRDGLHDMVSHIKLFFTYKTMVDRVLVKRALGKNGCDVSQVGFGAAAIGNLYNAISTEQACLAIDAAWDAGIRLFDTAPHYGQGLSERRLGDVLRDKPRDDFVLSTKVGRLLVPAGHAEERHGYRSPMPFDIAYDYSYDGIMRSFEDSLQRLGLDSIDVLLVHDIGQLTHGDAHQVHFKTLVESGYRALSELRDAKLVKAIGLGVNEYEVCEQALKYNDYDCFLLAGCYTLLEQSTLEHFLPLCQQRGIGLLMGGVYNSGILATGTQADAVPYYDYQPAPSNIVSRVQRIEAVCEYHQVTLAAAALQFSAAHPAVSSVVPGVSTPVQVQGLMGLMDEKIPAGFWQSLKDQKLIRNDAPVPEAL